MLMNPLFGSRLVTRKVVPVIVAVKTALPEGRMLSKNALNAVWMSDWVGERVSGTEPPFRPRKPGV